MNGLALAAAIGIGGGIAIALQAPLASLLNQRLGLLESIFIVHLGGALAIAVPLLAVGGGKLGSWQQAPWYALGAGVLGIAVISALVYMVPRIGVASAVILVVAGQFSTAMVLDHFGAFGVTAQPVTLQRLAGIALVFAGVWIAVRAGSAA